MTSKYLVFKALAQSKGQPVSGQQIAEDLGLSRNAVWKAIESLRGDGHQILSKPGRGYQLLQTSTKLAEESLRLSLSPPFEAGLVQVHQKSISTNSLAKEAMEASQSSAVIASLSQEGGKARAGKSFFSPKGGLYFSFAYKPQAQVQSASLLTIKAALAVVEAFSELYDQDLAIKWVNDLIYKGKKVAGILTEASLSLETLQVDYIICGIGLNILAPKEGYPPDIEDRAGPIFETLPENFNPNQLIGKIIDNFFSYQDLAKTIQAYKNRCLTLGQEVQISQAGQVYQGLAKDIDHEGRLVMVLNDGREISLTGGY